MIALIVALALMFAWAVIATAVAVAHNIRANQLGALLSEERDRSMATTLTEYRIQPFDVSPHPDAVQRTWVSDPFGMSGEWVDAE